VQKVSHFIQSFREPTLPNGNATQKSGATGRPEAKLKLLNAVKSFFSSGRHEAIAKRISTAVPREATKSVKTEASSTRASSALNKVSTAFSMAGPEQKNSLLLSAVRITYRDSLTEVDLKGADQLAGKNHEMTVSMLNSKLSKLLSNQSISSDDLKYIEKAVPHFEGKLPDEIKESLRSALMAHRPTTELPKNQTMVATTGMQALQSPASHGRNADSERISGSAASPIKKTLTPAQAESRSQFERKLRQSLEGTTAFPVEKVVAIAGTVLKEIMLESQLTREKFSQKFEEATKVKFRSHAPEDTQLLMLKYAEHAYDETIKPHLPQ
jgi:hypothetical protein